MAIVLKEQGKLDEAMARYEEALRIKKKSLGPEHASVGDTLYNMALVLKKQGNTFQFAYGFGFDRRMAAAASTFDECARIYASAYGPEHAKTKLARLRAKHPLSCVVQ